MTILEAGIIAGAPVGAATGGVLGGAYGPWATAGSVTGGLVAGGAAGWLFALALIVLLSVVGVLWRAARRLPDDPPSEADMRTMTPVAVAGTFVGAAAAGGVGLVSSSWLPALVTLMTSALLTALLAVGRCELRRAE